MKHPFSASLLPALCLFFISHATAFGNASELTFSPEEISAQRQNGKLIADTAAACLSRTWDLHNKFYKQRGYSKFYGNRHPKHKTEEGRRAVLLQLLPQLEQKVRRGDPAALAELAKREAELEATSCVGLTLKCLGEGFNAAGQKDTWDRIFTWVGRTGADGAPMFYGTDLQKALVDLGWRSVYFNPDISQNDEWDMLDKESNPSKGLNPTTGKEQWNPVWGGHAYRWAMVKRNRDYYGIPVQDIQTLVNFGIEPPADFKAIPFFVGTAHAGYHVFPGFKGNIIEAHSMRELKSINNMEVGAFNPLYQELNGIQGGNGAPKWTKSEHYRSGMIVVPPGMLADKPFVQPPPSMSTPPNNSPRPDVIPGDGPLDLRPGQPQPRDPWGQPGWGQPEPRRRDRFLPPWLR